MGCPWQSERMLRLEDPEMDYPKPLQVGPSTTSLKLGSGFRVQGFMV